MGGKLMLNRKAIDGLLKATPEKRYKSFLNMVTDLEEVWLLSSNCQITHSIDEGAHISLWPCKELCMLNLSNAQQSTFIEIHDFLEQCKSLDESFSFVVFPTHENSYKVTAKQLCLDIQEHLDELE